MKNPLSIAILLCLMCMGCQSETSDRSTNENKDVKVTEVSNKVVDAACGECQFGMEGNSCDLAIRIDGASYFVDGSAIDDHGDAHGKDGMCNCIRKAKVSGEIKNDRFVASSFEVLPVEKNQPSVDD